MIRLFFAGILICTRMFTDRNIDLYRVKEIGNDLIIVGKKEIAPDFRELSGTGIM